MKALILSVGTGHGHNQVAKAIRTTLCEKENITVDVVDVFEYINPVLGKSISEGYLIATKYLPEYYGSMYRKAENKESTVITNISEKINVLLSKKLRRLVEDFSPDLLIFTHVFAARMFDHINYSRRDAIKIGVITDYTIHPFWENTSLDYYIVPADSLVAEASSKGIDPNKVLSLGMPLNSKFSTPIKKAEAASILGIENRRTVLVMGGSMGYGNIDEKLIALDRCHEDFQIVCVCGNNNEMYERIKQLSLNKKLILMGFVDYINVLMSAADLIVTKPGGITISECLVKKLPMILVNPIPGQEDRNLEFLTKAEAALNSKNVDDLTHIVDNLLSNNAAYNKLLSNLSKLSKPNACNELCQFILSQLEAVS